MQSIFQHHEHKSLVLKLVRHQFNFSMYGTISSVFNNRALLVRLWLLTNSFDNMFVVLGEVVYGINLANYSTKCN